jgi:hypothetical protein
LNDEEKNMGRKGVSKRKPAQKKGKQLASDNAGGIVSSLGRATGIQPVKFPEADKAVNPAVRGSVKPSSDPKKTTKKR